MTDGFLRVAAVAPHVRPADVNVNTDAIIDVLTRLEQQGVELAVMPELGITAYTCGDLFHNATLLESAACAIARLAEWSENHNIAFVVGAPLATPTAVYNCGILVDNGALYATAKSHLPGYNEFYEPRWFKPCPNVAMEMNVAGRPLTFDSKGVFTTKGVRLGIEICEELWVPKPKSADMALAGAEVIANLSASPDLVGKYDYLRNLIASQSGRCLCTYIYAGAGADESTTDVVLDAKAIIAENGSIRAASPRWGEGAACAIFDTDILALRRDRQHQTTFRDTAAPVTPLPRSAKGTTDLRYRSIDPHPFVPSNPATLAERCAEIFAIQTTGLLRRVRAIHCPKVVIGISGGLDSTLALLVAVKALGPEAVIGVTMPGFGTTGRTYRNAIGLMEALGVEVREVNIAAAVNQHFQDIRHNPTVHDVTYENSQARERTQILMDIANQANGIVVGTGDMSELALGWATYNGDHMSMYGVNAGVPKTLVRHLVEYVAATTSNAIVAQYLTDIAATPISPELLPANADGTIQQVTEDLVGPYELHDFFLYYTLRFGFTPRRIYLLARHAFLPEQYSDDTLRHWLDTFFRRFFQQQFKRSCMPDGPKVGSVCLSPRGDWRMPSDAVASLWRNS